MKSSSADPDLVAMSRFNAATDAWLRAMSSVTMAGSVSIGAGAPPAGVARRALVRAGRDEVAAVDDGLQRVPRSADRDLPMACSRPARPGASPAPG